MAIHENQNNFIASKSSFSRQIFSDVQLVDFTGSIGLCKMFFDIAYSLSTQVCYTLPYPSKITELT